MIKKIFKGIRNIFNPVKLATMVNFSFLIGLLLTLALVFASFGTANMTAEKYVMNSLGDKYFINYDECDFEAVDAKELYSLEKVEVDSSTLTIKSNDEIIDSIVHSTYKDKNTNQLMNIDVVYELNYDERLEVSSTNKVVNEEFITNYLTTVDDSSTYDILIILTKTNIYMLLNHGYCYDDGEYTYNYLTFEYQNKENDEDEIHEIFEYYLPTYSGDTTSKTISTTKGTSNEYGECYKYLKKLSSVFSSVIPELTYYSYNNSELSIVKKDSLELAKEISKYYVEFWTSNTKLVNSCRAAFPYYIILPLLVIVVTWLISRKKGNLRSFKEYYNLNIFTLIPIVVIDLILGIFIPYEKFVIPTAVVMELYYCIMSYIINNKERIKELEQENHSEDTLNIKDEIKNPDKVLSINEEREEVNRIG